MRWLGLRTVGYYLAVALGIAAFQRSLIYIPTRLKNIDLAIAGLPAGRVHDLLIPTEDGLELHAWHFLPEGHEFSTRDECDAELARANCLFLFFHGNGGSRIDRVADCRSLAGRDNHVFILDYRGYGDNDGSPSETGLARDAMALWKYATEQRRVDPRRIVLYGESIGGGVTTQLASALCEANSPPGGLVLVGTFSSLTDAASYHYPWLPVRLLLIDRFPSVDRAPQISCPVLQIHGTHDDIVPLELGRRLFAAFPEASRSGVPKQFAQIRGAGHNDLSEATFEPLVKGFLERVR